MPAASAPRARRRLISAARSVPPVIDEITSGARSGRPRNVVATSTSASAISGSASWRRRTPSQPASSREATSSCRQTSRWRLFRASVDSAIAGQASAPRLAITSPMDSSPPAYDGTLGTAGGPAFGAALPALAAAPELDPALLAAVVAGSARLAVPALARLARALRLRPIAFMQQTELLGLQTYAGGLDPLYFLPDGQIRYDARIYMREINPRHAVPEYDMTKRSPVLRALADDTVADALGKLELELAYLLRAAVQQSGGTL